METYKIYCAVINYEHNGKTRVFGNHYFDSATEAVEYILEHIKKLERRGDVIKGISLLVEESSSRMSDPIQVLNNTEL